MNEFELFEALCDMGRIAKIYPRNNEINKKVEVMKERLKTRLYRVAVIGEFKRGKSSLVNALLGSSILPTNILPTTAVINRIRYGDDNRIIVHFKDGKIQECPLEELIDYGTMLTEESEQNSDKITEIEVIYPSVFCQNNIEILDTPGLNDNEKMSEKTLGVLKDIDCAIVVIHAEYQISASEKELIVQLLEQSNIHHVAFVVTFIDRFDDVEGQNRVLEFISQIIKSDTYEMARNRHRDNSNLLKKDELILSNPIVLGVSTKLAMAGFITGNRSILEKSRFPALKERLLAFLTSSQSGDLKLMVAELAKKVKDELPIWNKDLEASIESQWQKLKKQNKIINLYIDKENSRLQIQMKEMDERLAKKGLLYGDTCIKEDFVSALGKCFIKKLSMIRLENFTDKAICEAIESGMTDASKIIDVYVNNQSQLLHDEMNAVEVRTVKCVRALPQKCRIAVPIGKWQEHRKQFPIIAINIDSILLKENLTNINVMPIVNDEIRRSIKEFQKALNGYISAWRVMLFDFNNIQVDVCRKNKDINPQDEVYFKHKEEQCERQLSDFLNRMESIISHFDNGERD